MLLTLEQTKNPQTAPTGKLAYGRLSLPLATPRGHEYEPIPSGEEGLTPS